MRSPGMAMRPPTSRFDRATTIGPDAETRRAAGAQQHIAIAQPVAVGGDRDLGHFGIAARGPHVERFDVVDVRRDAELAGTARARARETRRCRSGRARSRSSPLGDPREQRLLCRDRGILEPPRSGVAIGDDVADAAHLADRNAVEMGDVRHRRAFHVLHRPAGARFDVARRRIGARAGRDGDELQRRRRWETAASADRCRAASATR